MVKFMNRLKKLIERKEKITHIIVTDKYSFPCYKSAEVGGTDLDGYEYVLYIMDCKYNGERKIVTVGKDNILFIMEDYTPELWEEIDSYVYGESDGNPTIEENSIYG